MRPAERYSRQTRFRPIGEAGQARIARASVLLVGVGALGTHLADMLVRAGIGRLWLVDRDIVELSNLQRQILFGEADAAAGTPKAIAAAAQLARIDSQCRIEPLVTDFGPDTYAALRAKPDLILDGTDNIPTRHLLTDLAVKEQIPWIYGGAIGAEGMALAVLPGWPCLRCLLPEAPPAGEGPTCETAGILAPTIAAVTAFQGVQALKILAGTPEAVPRGLHCWDLWRNTQQVLLADAQPDPACATCGTRTFPALTLRPPQAQSLCGREAVQVLPVSGQTIELDRLAAHLHGARIAVEHTDQMLRFAADGCRFSVFRGGRAIVFGTADLQRARALYDRWIGAR